VFLVLKIKTKPCQLFRIIICRSYKYKKKKKKQEKQQPSKQMNIKYTSINLMHCIRQTKSTLRTFYGRHHALINRYRVFALRSICVRNDHGYVQFVVIIIQSFPHLWLIIGLGTRNKNNTTAATSRAGSTYPSGAPEFTLVFNGVCVTRSVVLCVCFVDRCLSFCTFSFGHCVVCSSSIYEFWLPLWYL
jgi:hypothetical protein